MISDVQKDSLFCNQDIINIINFEILLSRNQKYAMYIHTVRNVELVLNCGISTQTADFLFHNFHSNFSDISYEYIFQLL